jgi:hypothetical protein
MMRTVRPLALAAFLVVAGGCTSTGMFEDVGVDPHPPSVQLLAVLPFVPAPPTPTPTPVAGPDAASQRARTIQFDTGGLTVRVGDLVQFTVSYADPGADLVDFRIRDLDSPLNVNLVPGAPKADINGDGVLEEVGPPPKYFPGTKGIAVGPDVGFTINTKMAGPHRFELWAEDSHSSRSEKVEFVINIEL